MDQRAFFFTGLLSSHFFFVDSWDLFARCVRIELWSRGAYESTYALSSSSRLLKVHSMFKSLIWRPFQSKPFNTGYALVLSLHPFFTLQSLSFCFVFLCVFLFFRYHNPMNQRSVSSLFLFLITRYHLPILFHSLSSLSSLSLSLSNSNTHTQADTPKNDRNIIFSTSSPFFPFSSSSSLWLVLN